MGYSDRGLENVCNALFNRINSEGIPHRMERDSALARLRQAENEFYKNGIISRKFQDFSAFFSELLWWSYGLTYGLNSNGKPTFENRYKNEKKLVEELRCLAKTLGEILPMMKKHSDQALPEKSLEEIKVGYGKKAFTFEERLDGTLLKKVDMFCLIHYLIENYPQKYKSYGGFEIKEEIEAQEGKIRLTAGFNENFWENIFNDYDLYQGTNGKDICLFNRARHSIASFLHSAHPAIHYLNVKAEEGNNPLCTAILLEGRGKNSNHEEKDYLLVEGVIGNFGRLDREREKVYGFLWKSIKEYALKKKKGRIFLNTCHSGNQIEPEEFLEYVAKKEGVSGRIQTSGEGEKTKTLFRMEKPGKVIADWGTNKEGEGVWFTHEFKFEEDPVLIQKVSNKDHEHFLYDKGEQYVDLFHLAVRRMFPDKEHFNSFFKLGGHAQGFEVKVALGDYESERQSVPELALKPRVVPKNKIDESGINSPKAVAVGSVLFMMAAGAVVVKYAPEIPEIIPLQRCKIDNEYSPPKCTIYEEKLEALGKTRVLYEVGLEGEITDQDFIVHKKLYDREISRNDIGKKTSD